VTPETLTSITLSDADRARIVREHFPREGLFAGHEWRVSPRPFPLGPALAEELDSLIYAIQYNTYDDLTKDPQMLVTGGIRSANGETLSTAYARANRYLNLIADETGGRFFLANTVGNLRQSFTRIAKELRQQYSVGYYPKNQGSRGEKRQIKVHVNLPKVAVRARQSYVYAAQLPPKN